jgi:tRNA pseudouridine55 synthase
MILSFHGLLVVDKPGGMTSRAAVDRAWRWFPRGTRIGHTGTLDPLATGVLVLCVGQATRLGEYVQRMTKTYRAGLLLGVHSDTDDADGTVTPVPDACVPEAEFLARASQEFVGEHDQVPPVYSAAKQEGRRAYDLARRGQTVSLTARTIQIYAIKIIEYVYPRLSLEVTCGKGTYIRALARDLGDLLGCGALVETLRRLHVGPFETAQALSLEAEDTTARSRLLPMARAVCDLPCLQRDGGDVTRLRRGQGVDLMADAAPASLHDRQEVAVLDEAGRLAAVAIWDEGSKQLLPVKVLAAG